jgi:hypothetical protein
MGKAKWLVVVLGGLAAGNAFAEGGRAELQITPYVGYSHLRIDSPYLLDGEAKRMDQLLGGVTAGFLTPFGAVVEVGNSEAFHEDIFEDDNDFSINQRYVAVGYQFDFSDGWRFVPKVGRARWRLYSDDRALIDTAGERHETLRGYNNFFEASLMRHVSESIALGINYKDIDSDFGHSRSGAFVVTFGF